MDINKACQRADRDLDEDVKREIEQLKKDNNAKLEECQKKQTAEKKRGDNLYLKYGDPQPNSLDYLYLNNDDFPIQGDDKLTYKMIDMSMRNKQSMINRALWNKNSLLPYFEEELKNHANSVWYDDDALENEF
jgi:hypothetical protein